MKTLIDSVKKALLTHKPLPFSVYTSIKEQHILNVPLANPTLIFVLSGQKKLGQQSNWLCQSGDFIFLSNHPGIDMRNIPKETEYFALLIEFDYEDFEGLEKQNHHQTDFFIGNINQTLETSLQQFVEWSLIAPASMWSLRRREIVHLLYQLGYTQVSSIIREPGLTKKLSTLIKNHIAEDLATEALCSQLNMSESTLRRRLKAEQTNLQTIKDNVKLGYGLHLLQSTAKPIGHIAAECGYQSQSRFTDKFKQKFGLTPSELRKTRMTE